MSRIKRYYDDIMEQESLAPYHEKLVQIHQYDIYDDSNCDKIPKNRSWFKNVMRKLRHEFHRK